MRIFLAILGIILIIASVFFFIAGEWIIGLILAIIGAILLVCTIGFDSSGSFALFDGDFDLPSFD